MFDVPVVPIPFPEQGNDLYPLPADFDDLDRKGKRVARVNACRQWLLWNEAHQKEAKARAYIASTWYFDEYYLTREVGLDGSIEHEPMFYRNKIATPNFHWAWRKYIAIARHFAGVGPRGGAKTFFHALNILHWMVTCPMFGVSYATSTNELAQEMGDRCKFQCYGNSRLNDDWAPEYGVKSLKPRRTEGKMGMSSFKLTNRSEFFATSAKSRQRGIRPVKYILDDPEWDPSSPEAASRDVEAIERLLFDVALPMVQQAGTSLIWTGTFISLRHYLWQAMASDEVTLPTGETISVARNKLFRNWTRIISPSEVEIDGKRRSTWPEMWPSDSAERTALGLSDDVRTLEEIEEDVGSDVYDKEFRCKPGNSKGAYFPELELKRHCWVFGEVDANADSEPVISDARVIYHHFDRSSVHDRNVSLRELLSVSPRFILCDTAWSANPLSDWRTAICCLLTPSNDLFLLDAWAAKCKEDEHVEQLFLMSQKWKAASICVEHITSGKSLADRIDAAIKNRSLDVGGITHWPTLRTFNPGLTDKPTKIARVGWRFRYNRIKLPWHVRHLFPWNMLWHQIANFHPDLPDGGLEKDDMIDTVSMSQYVVHGRPLEAPDAPSAKTIVDRILAGEKFNENGDPLAFIALQTCSPDEVQKIIAHVRGSPGTPKKALAI